MAFKVGAACRKRDGEGLHAGARPIAAVGQADLGAEVGERLGNRPAEAVSVVDALHQGVPQRPQRLEHPCHPAAVFARCIGVPWRATVLDGRPRPSRMQGLPADGSSEGRAYESVPARW
jgi:hypothetical protein